MSEKVNFYGSEWERKRDVRCPIHVSVYVYGLCRALVAFLSSLMAFCFVPLRGLYFTGTNKAIVGHVYRCLVYFSLKITLSYSPGGISFAVDWKIKKMYSLFSVWFLILYMLHASCIMNDKNSLKSKFRPQVWKNCLIIFIPYLAAWTTDLAWIKKKKRIFIAWKIKVNS